MFGFAFLSCTQAPVKRFYTLSNIPMPGGALPDGEKACSRTVVLASLETSAPYDEDKIIFRTDAYEIKYFNYRLWVSPPREMLDGLLVEKLDRARVFKAVESFSHSDADHLTLYGRLNVIEELEDEKGWNARLAMSFRLKSARDENIIWKYRFDRTEKVGEEKIELFLRVMNKIYNEEIDKMIAALAHFIPSHIGCRNSG
jgi:ABC-type uncharacterized transport system auxiliary subunit